MSRAAFAVVVTAAIWLAEPWYNMHAAEKRLLDKGISWWTAWKKQAGDEPSSVSVKVRDVALGNGKHIHVAEYSSRAGHPKKPTKDGTDKYPLVCEGGRVKRFIGGGHYVFWQGMERSGLGRK